MRKEKTIILDDRGRELTFRVKEMPATKLESWIVRAGLLLASTGLLSSNATPEVGDVLQTVGKALASNDNLQALARVDIDKAQPLLDDLLGCCTHVASGGIEQRLTPDVVDGIIEDIRTLFALRKEALMLNFGFFASAGQSDTDASPQPRQDTQKPKISVRSRR